MSLLYWLLGLDQARMIGRATQWAWYLASPTAWLWLTLVGLAALATAGLNLLPNNVMPWRTRLGLTCLRLGGFALLLLILTQLELWLTVERNHPPKVAVLTDVSASMALADVDGQQRLAAARAFGDRLASRLGQRVGLPAYQFSWRLEAEDRQTPAAGLANLMKAVGEVVEREDNLQAVVLLTDGNDSTQDRGELVAPLLAERGIPVYPVVFGDPAPPKMARLQLRGAGDYVRLGDELRIVADLTAENLPEQRVRVQLYEEGAEAPLATRENVPLGAGKSSVAFVVRPEKPGWRRYRIVAEGVQGVASDQLLAVEHQVEVIDSRIRVLYLDITRDERKLLGHWLARDPVVDLAVLTMLPKGGWYAQGVLHHENAGDGLPSREEDLYQYDLIILGDLPRAYFRGGGDVAETKMRWLAEFVAQRGGGLITLGGRSVYAAGQYQDSTLANLLPFQLETSARAQVEGLMSIQPTSLGLSHPLMQLEAEYERNREAWFDLPRLDGCNRVGAVKPGASLLATFLVDGEQLPVIALQPVGKGAVLSLTADTTWRWQMQRPADGPDYYRRFWGNAIRVLAPDPRLQPERPLVQRYRSAVPVGRQLTMSARLVNALYRPLRNADVEIEVTPPDGPALLLYPQDGVGSPGLYEYDLDIDQPGQWTVTTRYQDKSVVESFMAGDHLEALQDPRARPQEMAAFAELTGGRSFAPGQLDELVGQLPVTPRQEMQTYTVAVWNRPVVMLLMVLAVVLDCLIRKRRGMV